MELHFVTCDITIALATTFWALDKPGPMYHNICHESQPGPTEAFRRPKAKSSSRAFMLSLK